MRFFQALLPAFGGTSLDVVDLRGYAEQGSVLFLD
jgi:hypothetical protein